MRCSTTACKWMQTDVVLYIAASDPHLHNMAKRWQTAGLFVLSSGLFGSVSSSAELMGVLGVPAVQDIWVLENDKWIQCDVGLQFDACQVSVDHSLQSIRWSIYDSLVRTRATCEMV